MQQQTDHWILQVIPKYVRKPYNKIVEEIKCNCTDPESIGFMAGNDPNCIKCRGVGYFNKDVTPKPPPPPEIEQEYIDHMRKAHKEFFQGTQS